MPTPQRFDSIPDDCALLPLDEGGLLVSRSHAVYCRVPAAEVESIERVLRGERAVAELGEPLRDRLSRHGFFGPPRPGEDEPPLVQLQLTNECNLACEYCCTDSGRPRGAELGLDRWTDIFETARRVLGPETRFAILGGEPLLSPHVLPLARKIVDRGHRLTLFTNGMLLVDTNLARAVAELSARGAEIRVSLAGASAQSCDVVSGAKRYEGVLQGLEMLATHGGEAVVDLVLTPDNSADTAQSFHVLRRTVPESFRIALALLYLGGRERGDHLFGSRRELEGALDLVTFGAGETIAATAPSPVTFRREACSCALGDQIAVRSDGALYTCFKLEEQVGHVDRQGFEATLEWVRANPRPATGYPLCADCVLATLCGGGCRTENKLYTGDGGTPVCGPWRVRVLCELLAEDVAECLDWPAAHLLAEARARGIEAPAALEPLPRPA
jgi:radical SAM protein with 4Fe4S-binding SPASM domain